MKTSWEFGGNLESANLTLEVVVVWWWEEEEEEDKEAQQVIAGTIFREMQQPLNAKESRQ